jgi:glycerophosphoryl diester phosphodiesterase
LVDGRGWGRRDIVTSVFAHRGCSDAFVENTLEAFAEARRLGADGVELDVRLTADGALAVHHDAEIPGLGPISELAATDLPGHVPLLADALSVCEGMVVNVEIKNSPDDPGHDPGEAVAALTAAAIDDASWTGRVLISSFQLSTLRAVQVADARLALGALWPFLAPPDDGLVLAVDEGFQAVHPFVTNVSPALVEKAHAAGLAVNVWTVNATEDLTALVGLGVDAVITDRLAHALAIARGDGG